MIVPIHNQNNTDMDVVSTQIDATQIDATQWMNKYYEYLKNYARKRISDEWKVDEVIQETFYAGLKSQKGFKNRASERTWLTAILKNKIVDYYRKQASKKGQVERYMISHEQHNEIYYLDAAVTTAEETQLADVECEELKHLITKCIDALPTSLSRVARLKFYDNLSTEEISYRLNISTSNVWVCLHRARTSIASELNKYDYAV